MLGIKPASLTALCRYPPAPPPLTAPCGTQSVVHKTAAVYAKVVTFLSTVTAVHSDLTGET